ncbi:MAG: hypothetical protein ABI672_20920 [Vicinamibacteria bacterium]
MIGRAARLVCLGLVMGGAFALARTPVVEGARFEKAPEFPSQDPKEWIGPPQSMKALAGKVVILDVWTFG